MSVHTHTHIMASVTLISVLFMRYKQEDKTPRRPYLLQCVGDVRLHLCVLCEDQTGQQGGALLGRQWAQDVLEQQLGQQQLVAADLTSHAAFQLHRPAAVDVLEGL